MENEMNNIYILIPYNPYNDYMDYIWVNYNDLTVLPNPGIMVYFRETIPKTALFQVSELL
jgi:hypothetical protein